MSAETILDVRELEAAFFTRRGTVHAVQQVSFGVEAGQTLGIVGESGSGKSATALSIMRSLPFPGRVIGGHVLLADEDLQAKSEREMSRIRGRDISLVPQDSTVSLNPLLKIGAHLTEVIQAHTDLDRGQAQDRALELLNKVGIPDPEARLDDYAHQLSGGMRQRVMVAMAISCNPVLLIADEPTTALDATVQAQILELIQSLSYELHNATILITHNLGVVAGICDKVAVMYAGRIVEMAPVGPLYGDPRHPYTISLLQCVPRLDQSGVFHLRGIPGRPPDLVRVDKGCSFAPRCPLATEQCRHERPILELQEEDHLAACWNTAHIGEMKR